MKLFYKSCAIILAGLGFLAVSARAQPRLQTPATIPAGQTQAARPTPQPSAAPQPAVQLGMQPQPAAAPQSTPPAPVPAAAGPRPADLMADMLGGPRTQDGLPVSPEALMRSHDTSSRADNAPASTVIGGVETPFYGSVPSLPPSPPRSAQHEEMITRMKMAVEDVAAQYGNPSFAQVFTNDPVRAKVLRRRMEVLKQVDRLNAEIATLETHRTQSQQELQVTRQRVESSKQELKTIQDQVREMNTRLQNARNLLQSLAQQ
ncbi:hypothetical protein OH491_16990 [Termitidicoccus mucosus]|uniref:Secreted protein n=1 Tax=Termitidicoccus mucosus TaxID=1184151 RepID=A0A178IL11_9BACT|nr:hypothetical protein AW736_11600 [Opitutaceae bacterium TSB47]